MSTLQMLDYVFAFIRVLKQVYTQLLFLRSDRFFVAGDAYPDVFVAPNLYFSTAIRTRKVFRNRSGKIPYPWTSFEVGPDQVFFIETVEALSGLLIAFSAGSFIYLAASELIPELHEEKTFKKP